MQGKEHVEQSLWISRPGMAPHLHCPSQTPGSQKNKSNSSPDFASGGFSKSHLELAVEDELGGVNDGACGSARCKAVYSSQKLLSSKALFFLKVSKNIQNIQPSRRGSGATGESRETCLVEQDLA